MTNIEKGDARHPMKQGRCNCGAIRFLLRGKLPAHYQCYCSLCRKQSGAGSNLATLIDKDQFEWTSSTREITQWKKTSGFNSHFCRTCGSPVPNIVADKFVWIPVGLLEEWDADIVAELFNQSIHAENEKPSDTLLQLPHGPENIATFANYLMIRSN